MYAPKDWPFFREALTWSNIHNDLLCLSFCSAIDWLKATMQKMDKGAFPSFLVCLW